MDNCIFCKIIKGEIPSEKVYEDDKVLAFLDIAPNNKGHTLVVTKDHYETFNDVPQELFCDWMIVLQKVSKAVVNATSCQGYNILMNNKKVANQLVPHVHFHVIPRNQGDGVVGPWKHGRYEEGEMEEFASAIKKKL